MFNIFKNWLRSKRLRETELGEFLLITIPETWNRSHRISNSLNIWNVWNDWNMIESQFKDKTPLSKPESFVDNSLVDQLEKSGFIDSVYK